MAHTKAAGKARQGTPRKGRRLGLKVAGGSLVKKGSIVLRQAGSSFRTGSGVKTGRDFTIYALKDGVVTFRTLKSRKIVEVL